MEQVTIIRTDRETGKQEQVSLSYAVQKLQGYWDDSKITEMLMQGNVLFTPYADYQIHSH
jgi:hypothetical protein